MPRPTCAASFALLAPALALACRSAPPAPEPPAAAARAVPAAVAAALESYTDGEVCLAFSSLAPGAPWSYAHRGDDVLHAASTMKVPVLVALHRAAHVGALSLDDTLVVRNEFESIVDGSLYTLSPDDDSDPELYAEVGAPVALHELARRMIVRSSNLATNLLVQHLGPEQIQQTIEALGVTHMRVLRGVEDGKAFAAGLSNTATANDLARLMATIAGGQAVSEAHSARMLAILEAQEFNELIPAGLPPGTRVAHKTGSITGIVHDAAIVFPAGRAPYVLVVLTRGFEDPARAAEAIRAVAAAAHAASAD
jgi:beta-lactamase class A